MAQVQLALGAVDHSWLRVLLRAVVTCRRTLPLPRQQVPQLLVGREHTGKRGMHRLQGACGRWPGAGSMVAVGAQELILRVHVKEAKGRGNRATVCMGNWGKLLYYTEVVCISEVGLCGLVCGIVWKTHPEPCGSNQLLAYPHVMVARDVLLSGTY